MASAEEPLSTFVCFFFPARSKCYSVLGTIQTYPGKPQRVPAVFVPGAGRTENRKGHAPTAHDEMSPMISANEGHALGDSRDSMAFRRHPFSPLLYVLLYSPTQCVKVLTSALKSLASFLGSWERRLGEGMVGGSVSLTRCQNDSSDTCFLSSPWSISHRLVYVPFSLLSVISLRTSFLSETIHWIRATERWSHWANIQSIS